MAVSFTDYLVIGISSRALFDLEEANEIYEKDGLDAYRKYQIEHEDEILKPGTGFNLVKNLLNINKKLDNKQVEVIVMSRNSAETSLRIMNSLDYYGLEIGRMVMSGGESISKYLKVFDVDLFLSCNEQDVSDAINAGFPAGIIYNSTKDYVNNEQIRIAFDADAVLFSAESEKIYQKDGLEAFVENEVLNQDVALKKGPLTKFLFGLSRLQKLSMDQPLIRTAIVTARDRNAGKRIIKTLFKWNVFVDEVFFLQGAKKQEILAAFGANIFFDDQDVHARPASEVVPSARVPYREGDDIQ
ncbi:MAG: 5'-nucleotidase [Holdemanella sp.]|nr:5'-nucleotidase [Holdemanella sp.]